MKAKFLIVYLTYIFNTVYAETTLLFATCLCAGFETRQGKDAVVEQSLPIAY